MAKIVIKKRVSLDFLGEEYKDSYLEFKSIPISSFEEIMNEFEGATDKENLKLTIKVLKDSFLSGQFLGDAVVAEDLDQFDLETLITCLSYLTGQKTDPKVENQ